MRFLLNGHNEGPTQFLATKCRLSCEETQSNTQAYFASKKSFGCQSFHVDSNKCVPTIEMERPTVYAKDDATCR